MITSDITNDHSEFSNTNSTFEVFSSLWAHLLQVIPSTPGPAQPGTLCSETLYAHEVSIAIRHLTWYTILDSELTHLCQSEAGVQGHGRAGFMARNSANKTHHGSITALDQIEICISESPSLSSIQHSPMHTGIIEPTKGCKCHVFLRKDRAQLPEITPGNSTPNNN